ncbi:hypothetical protein F4604DRAFT_1672138 [Suillus subluteus]|nr:hypothetical protein F4604DRAFT_1672138 [Suillus subluteus]
MCQRFMYNCLSHRIRPYSHSATSTSSTHGVGSSRRSESGSLASTSFAISPDEVESVQCLAEASTAKVVKKLLKDFSPTKNLAIAWVKRQTILNSVTTTSWLRNITDKEKKTAMEYMAEIVSQANLKFTCVPLADIEATPEVVEGVLKALLQNHKRLAQTSETFMGCHNLQPSDPNTSSLDHKSHMDNLQHITDTSIFVLLFANPGVEQTHLAHWYRSKYTPLRDEDMRDQLITTPAQMLAQFATATILVILRTASGKTSKLGNPIHFSTDPHANYQEAVHQALLLALASPIHGPALALHLLDLHERGLVILRGTLGLGAAVQAVDNPVTAEDSEIALLPTMIAAVSPPSTIDPRLLQVSESAHTAVRPDFGEDFLEFSEGRTSGMPRHDGRKLYGILIPHLDSHAVDTLFKLILNPNIGRSRGAYRHLLRSQNLARAQVNFKFPPWKIASGRKAPSYHVVASSRTMETPGISDSYQSSYTTTACEPFLLSTLDTRIGD